MICCFHFHVQKCLLSEDNGKANNMDKQTCGQYTVYTLYSTRCLVQTT